MGQIILVYGICVACEAGKIEECPELVYTFGELCHPQPVRTNKSAAICTRPGENHRHA